MYVWFWNIANVIVYYELLYDGSWVSLTGVEDNFWSSCMIIMITIAG